MIAPLSIPLVDDRGRSRNGVLAPDPMRGGSPLAERLTSPAGWRQSLLVTISRLPQRSNAMVALK